MTKADPATGVKCFSIGGRMVDVRQRCLGMTDEERRWRAQWLKDQILSPEEPRFVPEYYKATNNIFRRLFKAPLNSFEKVLAVSVGAKRAYTTRKVLGKMGLLLLVAYSFTYILKYHADNFATSRTLETFKRRALFPDHPDYPNYPVRKPYEYYDLGFYSSVLCQDAIPPPPPPPPPPSSSESLSQSSAFEKTPPCVPDEE